jgi:cobalamin biosynthesis protein CobC
MKHGGDLSEAMARFGGGRANWLDLSTGINPHAYPLPAIDKRFFSALPNASDLDALLLAARRAYQVPDRVGIIAAPGTQALIQWLPRLARPGRVGIFSPTYAEHEAAWSLAGHEVLPLPFDRASDALSQGLKHIVLVHPNNPDGHLFDEPSTLDLAKHCADAGGWLVIDESFIDLWPERTLAALTGKWPVIILRSFGKFYGLAGLRLGFAIAPSDVTAAITAALGAWAVSGPALEMARIALEDEAWAAAMRVRLADEAAELDALLSKGGFASRGGTPLYRLVVHRGSAAIHAALAERRIWVRRFDADDRLLRFGLPPSPAHRERLAVALAACVPVSVPRGP